MEHVSYINDELDLIEDTEDRSFYFQKYLEDGQGTTVQSQSFKSKDEAIEAFEQGKVEWA